MQYAIEGGIAMRVITKTKQFKIGGMTCVNCKNRIEKKLCGTVGVKSAEVSYSAGTANVAYDPTVIDERTIVDAVNQLGYQVLASGDMARFWRGAGILTAIAALYVLLQQFGVLNYLASSRLADGTTVGAGFAGYAMLFMIGLTTSVHCVAMCGGINLSQCIPQGESPAKARKAFWPALQYNAGRVIAYTVIGGLLGFAGMVFSGGTWAGLPALAQGILKMLAGLFMALMGINMLGLFPALRKLQLRIQPRKGAAGRKSNSPFIVGLLNGLMPCGPLQSMWIAALATGSPFAGALAMFVFSMGTIPLMLGFGSIVTALGQKAKSTVTVVGAVLVVVLGLAMFSQGGALSGVLDETILYPAVIGLALAGIASGLPFKKKIYQTIAPLAVCALVVIAVAAGNAKPTPRDINMIESVPITNKIENNTQVENNTQIVNSTLAIGRYPSITVEVGRPVEWIINAPSGSINGCNGRMNILTYGILNYAFQPGDNVIAFTPEKTGTFMYSCWMGMIRGSITVVEA
jgi:sulfite exporter TauE/SafE/copper chaperone CopZ